jgi:hypothetical protein
LIVVEVLINEFLRVGVDCCKLLFDNTFLLLLLLGFFFFFFPPSKFGFVLFKVRTLGTKFPILVTEALWYKIFGLLSVV